MIGLSHVGAKVLGMARLKNGSRITGAARDQLGWELMKKYEKGASIRALAESTGRLCGFIHGCFRRRV